LSEKLEKVISVLEILSRSAMEVWEEVLGEILKEVWVGWRYLLWCVLAQAIGGAAAI